MEYLYTMNDNDYEGMTQEYASNLHRSIAVVRGKELLPIRLRAIASVLLVDMVPLAVRLHILTSLTYACSLTEGVSPTDAAENMALLKDLLLGEKGSTLGKSLLNDPIVQRVLNVSDRLKDRTMQRVQEAHEAAEAREKAKVVQFPKKEDET